MRAPSTEWELPELAAAVAERLAALGFVEDAPDARVSARPDARTVRYYQTMGLVDRPRIAGRKARYGRRHLLQLTAIKALQAKGIALRAIQGRLLGLSDEALEAVAQEAAPARRASRGAAVDLRTVTRREATLAPGITLTVDRLDPASIDRDEVTARLQAALDALGVPSARRQEVPS